MRDYARKTKKNVRPVYNIPSWLYSIVIEDVSPKIRSYINARSPNRMGLLMEEVSEGLILCKNNNFIVWRLAFHLH